MSSSHANFQFLKLETSYSNLIQFLKGLELNALYGIEGSLNEIRIAVDPIK